MCLYDAFQSNAFIVDFQISVHLFTKFFDFALILRSIAYVYKTTLPHASSIAT